MPALGSQRGRITTVLSFFGGVAVLVVLLRQYGVEPSFALMRFHAGYAVAYIAMVGVVATGYSARWQRMARTVGTPMPLGRLIGARLAGDAVGALMPSAKVAGDPVRIALLHADGVPLVAAGAGVTLDRLCEMAGNVIAAALYVVVFVATRGAADSVATDVLLSVALLCAGASIPVVLLLVGWRPLGPVYWLLDGRLTQRWARALDGARDAEARVMRVFREHPRSFVLGVLLSLLIESLIIVEYNTLLRAVDIHLDLPTLMLMLVCGGLSRTVPSPGALGALEASQVAALTLAGQPAAVGLAAGLTIRIHESIVTAIGLVVCLARGMSPARLRVLAPDRGVA